MFVFILSQKKAIFYQCSLKKHLEPGTGKKIRHRTPTPSPTPTPNPRPINWVIRAAPNNCSETGLAGRAKNWDICQQTNNSSVRAQSDQLGCGLLAAPERTIAEFCDFFSARCNFYRETRANNYSLYRYAKGMRRNEQKKPEREALAFCEQSPFLSD